MNVHKLRAGLLRSRLRNLRPKMVSAEGFGRPGAFRAVTATKRARCLLAIPHRVRRLRVGSHPSSQTRASRLGFALLGQAYRRARSALSR